MMHIFQSLFKVMFDLSTNCTKGNIGRGYNVASLNTLLLGMVYRFILSSLPILSAH